MKKDYSSSIYLYYINKYIFFILILLFLFSDMKDGIYDGNVIVDSLLIFMFIVFQIFVFRVFRRVEVHLNFINIESKGTVNWKNVIRINRLYIYYIALIKERSRKRLLIFPVCSMPIELIGKRIEDTNMDQIITKKKNELNI